MRLSPPDLRSLAVLGLGVLLVSCSITRVKWRIKTDDCVEEIRKLLE